MQLPGSFKAPPLFLNEKGNGVVRVGKEGNSGLLMGSSREIPGKREEGEKYPEPEKRNRNFPSMVNATLSPPPIVRFQGEKERERV